MISLIAPSRGRAQKSFDNSREWITNCGADVELILSLDSDDPQAMRYVYLYGDNSYIEINNNSGVVSATNHAAKGSTGDILVYLSDDFKCFDNWGQVLINEFNKYKGPVLLKVDDMLQKFNVEVLTIPIMNRACYEALGYFFHPDFKSMHCDEHLYHRAKKLGFLKFAPHIKFEHQHVSVGKAQDDDTYRRSAANWNHGKETLAKHRRLGFTQ
jgi:hypothetical protein